METENTLKKINPKIVIIDTGVSKNHPKLYGLTIQGVEITISEDSITEVTDNYDDDIGHGTAICNIINGHNQEIDLYMIKIFNKKKLLASETLLIYALNFVLNNVQCDIINLSLGLCQIENKFKLYDVCEKLKKRGTIIISAFDNNGSISYPAAFDNVIGVTTGEHCRKTTDIEYVDNSIVNICAKGSFQRLAWVEPDYVVTGGNSFACAHVTGIVSKIYQPGITKYKDIMNYLKKIAKNIHNFNTPINKKEKKITFQTI